MCCQQIRARLFELSQSTVDGRRRFRTQIASFVLVQLEQKAIDGAKLHFGERRRFQQRVQASTPVVGGKDCAAQVAQKRRPHDTRNMRDFLIDQSVHGVPRHVSARPKLFTSDDLL